MDALRADPAKMYALVSEMIFPHFDFELMSKFVVGAPWGETDAAKQQALLKEADALRDKAQEMKKKQQAGA